jgi:hypothetical protein
MPLLYRWSDCKLLAALAGSFPTCAPLICRGEGSHGATRAQRVQFLTLKGGDTRKG